MRILIQHSETGLYLSGAGKWVKNAWEALAFSSEERARDHIVYRRLSQVSVVVTPTPTAPKAPPSRPAAAERNEPSLEPEHMKPKKTPANKATEKTPAATPSKAAEATPKSAPKAAVASAPAPTPAPASVPPAPKASKAEAKAKAPATKKAKPPGITKPAAATALPAVVPPRVELDAPAPAAQSKPPKPDQAPAVLVTTSVEARINVGFGNALFIRGEGDGLSWDEGKPLQCEASDSWVWSTTEAGGNLVFKLLINDEVWSQGEDWTVAQGQKTEVVPVF